MEKKCLLTKCSGTQEYILTQTTLMRMNLLHEEDAGGEEDLEDMVDGIEPSDEPVEEKNGEEDEDYYGFADDEEDEEEAMRTMRNNETNNRLSRL